MKFTQIATDGGLLPFPITRDSFELWPAKRREFIVDFTKYRDGSPTTKGDDAPDNWQTMLDNRLIFELERGSGGGEIEWMINGEQFDPTTVARSMKNRAGKTPVARQKEGSFNL